MINKFQAIAEAIVAAPFGSGEFYTLVGVATAVLFVLGKVLASSIGGSKRGTIPVFLGHVIIIAAGLLGAVLVLTFLADKTDSAGALRIAMYGIAIIFALIAIVLVSKPLLGTSAGAGLSTCIFALAIAYGTLWVGDKVFAILSDVEDSIERRQEKQTN